MSENNENINRLHEKLESLLKRQEEFSKEINELRAELCKLSSEKPDEASEKVIIQPEIKPIAANIPVEKEKPIVVSINTDGRSPTIWDAEQPRRSSTKPSQKSNIEKFIGENLINKIGIIITVIGVSIGVKYAIDHELISPLTRIVLGYLFGLGLLGFAVKLKKNYEAFSSVLLSGAAAVLYFITYAAYAFYDLIPQPLAFALMVIFTAFTVTAALHYNRPVIAHIGLVGAYAVPFLLSDDSGRVLILFSYMTFINIGILIVAVKKYWKSVYCASFGLTWVIYAGWYFVRYRPDEHFGLAFTFLFIFFVVFYAAFLAYKIRKNEKLDLLLVILLLINSFIFFGIGYSLLADRPTGGQLLGLFTLGNAVLHFLVCLVIYKQKLADKNLFYIVSGLVLVFITIAVPIQLNGNWVTLLWAGEAALVFWIGRTRNVPVYERLSYILILLAFGSLVHDWTSTYGHYYPEAPETSVTPFFNVTFLTSVLFTGVLTFILLLNKNKKYLLPDSKNILPTIVSFMIPILLLIVAYCAIRFEIAAYWDQLYADSAVTITADGDNYPDRYMNTDLMRFKFVWILNYSLLFLSILSFVNCKKIKNQLLGSVTLILSVLAVLVFLTSGLYMFSELRESYLEQTLSQYYHRGAFNIGIRYVSFAFLALMLATCYQCIKQGFMKANLKTAFDIIIHITILWTASSELIHWMDMTGSDESYKLGLSIFWGIYALLLVVLGIWKKKKYLRIGAIVLFGITLIKLFFYDISDLSTVAKTIVFVSLGILLLIISFLYNKYKRVIFDDHADAEKEINENQ